MLCEDCGKRNADVILTTVIDGESTTRHLCRECVKKYRSGDIQSLLAAILSSMSKRTADKDIACPKCGTSFAEFRKTGMLGCAECYQAFRGEIEPLMTRLQGRAQHAGRRPPLSEEEQARRDKIEALRLKMEAAVAIEDFETAAVYRDQLRAVTSGKGAEQ